jgi:hypothetical protein
MTWYTVGLESRLEKSLVECDGSLTENTGFGDGWVGNGIGSCYNDEHMHFYNDSHDGCGDGDDYGDADGNGQSAQ